MAHLFFSYAHADYNRLAPFFNLLEVRTERQIWIDRIGLQRDAEWAAMIERAIKSSYGAIFALTKPFIERPFILEKEIPWALERFNAGRQGELLFILKFDDVPIPDAINIPFVTHIVDATHGDWSRVITDLISHLPPIPTDQLGGQPFIMGWPRLRNFKGRDQQLIDLHHHIHVPDGKAAIKTAGLYGTGGIGKTQLAVEFAYRYRFYYPGGVYWINAAADWRKEVASCADRLDLKIENPSRDEEALRDQKIFAFERFLKQQNQDALIIMDNVQEPSSVLGRPLAPKLSFGDLCRDTRTRLIITTRIQKLPEGFQPVEVTKLSSKDALAVLKDAWNPTANSSARTDVPDESSLNGIAKLFDYLPLPLGWMAAALRQKTKLQPAALLKSLKESGVDATIQKLKDQKIELGTPEYYEALIGAGLDWQIEQMGDENALLTLNLIAAYDEAAVIPAARLRLLVSFDEDDLFDPFDTATDAMRDYSLAEVLEGGQAFRLHPLTRDHLRRKYAATTALTTAAPRLVEEYRCPTVFDKQVKARGFVEVLEDIQATRRALPTPLPELSALERLLLLESHRLLEIPPEATPVYVVQQWRDRAHHEGDMALCAACDQWLKGKPHIRAVEHSRQPAHPNLIRILKKHTDLVNRAIVLADGKILSWSKTGVFWLWTDQGMPINKFNDRGESVVCAVELKTQQIISLSSKNQTSELYLWDKFGKIIDTYFSYTTDFIYSNPNCQFTKKDRRRQSRLP
jgi:hypothetical protein